MPALEVLELGNHAFFYVKTLRLHGTRRIDASMASRSEIAEEDRAGKQGVLRNQRTRQGSARELQSHVHSK